MKVGDLIRFKQGSRHVALVTEVVTSPGKPGWVWGIRDIVIRWMDGRVRKDSSIRFEVVSESR